MWRVQNAGGTLYETWMYKDSGDNYRWYEGGVGWNAAGRTVREIELDTTYTVEIVYHPDTHKFEFTNDDGDNATTDNAILYPTDNVWWLIGDYATDNWYGQLKLDSIEIVNNAVKRTWVGQNSLLTEKAIVSDFDGNFMVGRNSLLTDDKATWWGVNTLLDGDPASYHYWGLNHIGETAPSRRTWDCEVWLDGVDHMVGGQYTP
jgi:hypothetical protein